jgi:alkylation response protein AidB-like acyl-CoA dehydrogenase
MPFPLPCWKQQSGTGPNVIHELFGWPHCCWANDAASRHATVGFPTSTKRQQMTPTSTTVRSSEWEHALSEPLLELEHVLSTLGRSDVAVDGRPADQAMVALRLSGLLGVVVPADFGGMGLDCTVANTVLTRVARLDPSVAILLYIHYGVVLRILQWGTGAQHDIYLNGAASGNCLMAAAWSETGRTSTEATATTATPTAKGAWLLEGEKTFTTATGIADVYLVLANVVSNSTGSDAADGVSAGNALFVVDGANPGVRPLAILELVGMSRSSTGSIRFAGCKLSAESALGTPDATLAIMRYPQHLGLTLGAIGLGIAAKAMDTVSEHITANRWKLTDRQRHHFFRMVCGLEAIRGLVERCGQPDADGDEDLALIAKAYASEGAETVCRDAQHILGSASLMATNPLSILQQDARSVGLMGPNNDACGVIVTNHLLERE